MKLYALCDFQLLESLSVSLDEFLGIAKSHNAEIIQYRDKISTISFIKSQLIYLRKNFDGFLIVNDRYELVEFCDGVHMGQEDLKKIDPLPSRAVKILRETIGSDKIIGISTHNEDEVLEANDMDINYIGLGAYRSTSTKQDVSTVLGDRLDEIAKLSQHSVGAIGGVRLSDKFKYVTYHVIGSGLLK